MLKAYMLIAVIETIRRFKKWLKRKIKIKAAVKTLAVKSAKFACGTASTNHFCQTKEPKTVSTYFKKKN